VCRQILFFFVAISYNFFYLFFVLFVCSSIPFKFLVLFFPQLELSKYFMRAINVKCICGVAFRSLSTNGLKQSYLWRLARKLQNKELVLHTFDRNACSALCDLVQQVMLLPDAVVAKMVTSTECGCSFISVFLCVASRLCFSARTHLYCLFCVCRNRLVPLYPWK
jgi:hypothetical protein